MNCKPGDMAVIVGGSQVWNYGAVVEVNRLIRNELWEVKPAWPLYGIEEHTGLKMLWVPGMLTTAEDKCLRPIRPPEQPVQIGQLEGLEERV